MRPRSMAAAVLLCAPLLLAALPDKPAWPLVLREGLPARLPGYAAAPSDPLPEENENEMGSYVEVSRFFQRIESPTSAKQFRLAVQDYGDRKDLAPALRKAFTEARQTAGVEAKETVISGHTMFVVTDRSSGRPTTLVTVIVSPGRLVLGQGANVPGDEAARLVQAVDLGKVEAARR